MANMPAPLVHSGNDGLAFVTTDFEIHEWSGGGPGYLHVHYSDNEAWHVLEGTLRFRLADGTIDAGPGMTVCMPAGVAHDYDVLSPARYLMILTPRLGGLIAALHAAPYGEHAAIMRQYDSEILEDAH
jgi:hypothetical protein